MHERNTLIHPFWIVEGDDDHDPPLQARSERAHVVRREQLRTSTPKGSKITYRDSLEPLMRRAEFAQEVLSADIDEVAKQLAEASNELLGIWDRIAKELGRS